MKSLKSIFKIAGAVMAVIGTVLVILGCLDEIREGFRKLAACRARREEMKDYADCDNGRGISAVPAVFMQRPAGRSSSRGSYFSVQPASSVTDGVSKVSTRRMLAPRAVSLPTISS